MKLRKRIQTRQLLTSIAMGLAVAVASVLSVPAIGQVVVYDTGFSEPVLFNGTSTNLGWTSGNAGAGNEQRWAAQPFTLGDETLISQVNASYFEPGAIPANIGVMIWNRTGELAPTTGDEVYSTTVTNPGASGAGAWAELALGTGVNLAAGDYYLTVFGVESSIGWFTGAPNGVQFVDANGPWMWRSATYPAPGFEFYQLDTTVLDANPGSDPNATYSAAFQLLTPIPEPGSISLLAAAVAGLLIRRRR